MHHNFCRIVVSMLFPGSNSAVKRRKIALLPERDNQLDKSVVIRMQAVVHPVFLTSPI
jgi:hypothetical protein